MPRLFKVGEKVVHSSFALNKYPTETSVEDVFTVIREDIGPAGSNSRGIGLRNVKTGKFVSKYAWALVPLEK